LSIGLARGVSASYSGNLRFGEEHDLTGRSSSRAESHSLQLTGTFMPPESWNQDLRSPIGLSVRLSMQRDRTCSAKLQSLDDSCVPTVDSRSRNMDVTLDTRLNDMNVGFRMSYTSRQSF